MQKIKIFILLCIIIISCNEDNIHSDLNLLLSNKISLPANVSIYKDNSVESSLIYSNCNNCKLKLISYSDSTSCNTCYISHLTDWGKIIEYSNQHNVEHIFILRPSKKDNIYITKK